MEGFVNGLGLAWEAGEAGVTILRVQAPGAEAVLPE